MDIHANEGQFVSTSANFGNATASQSFDTSGNFKWTNSYNGAHGTLGTNGHIYTYDLYGNKFWTFTNGVNFSNAATMRTVTLFTTSSNTQCMSVGPESTNSVEIKSNQVSVMFNGQRQMIVSNNGDVYITGQFTGNGAGLTNVSLVLGKSSTGSNGAAASWMLGLDSTGKTTTNAVPSGGSQTPITSDINYNLHQSTNLTYLSTTSNVGNGSFGYGLIFPNDFAQTGLVYDKSAGGPSLWSTGNEELVCRNSGYVTIGANAYTDFFGAAGHIRINTSSPGNFSFTPQFGAIYGESITIPVTQAGRTNCTAATSLTIFFINAMPSTNYTAVFMANNSPLTTPFVSQKTTTNFLANFGSLTSADIDWQVTQQTQ
jgi:hypothetical protein